MQAGSSHATAVALDTETAGHCELNDFRIDFNSFQRKRCVVQWRFTNDEAVRISMFALCLLALLVLCWSGYAVFTRDTRSFWYAVRFASVVAIVALPGATLLGAVLVLLARRK